ncbi:hypothetical protein EXIGLDRAFT_731949 [Exidia glandulosa HHB12029]|uniref:Uncharacterized protein n=1 Tax=Exidia glandulosa HHB12029 TaxID=1314781 RepID=A0A165BPR9_EXIGL|nr:hypothetical protein EXIGLDRAFT_731949 [Exidia glandulosa HHB12029]
MVLWFRLPDELVDAILVHAFIDSLQASRRWAASLLLISKSAQRWLAPRLYHTLRLTYTNAPAFIRLVEESHPSLLLLHTLIFDCGPESRTCLQEARTDILAQADITRYSGPRYIFAMLALCEVHPGFAPTHIRVDKVNMAFLLRHELSSAFSRLTHLYIEFLLPPLARPWPPQTENWYMPPTLRVVILRSSGLGMVQSVYQIICRDLAWFFTEDLERLTVIVPPMPGDAHQSRGRALLPAWAEERRETRLYLTHDAASTFDIDDNSG